MLKVRSTEEALILAKEMINRHQDLISAVGPSNTARDVAMRILLEELQTGEPISLKVQSSLKASGILAVPGGNDATSATGTHGDAGAAVGGGLRHCPYCSEPTSRYCKETGRRHQTPEDRALMLWKKCFRQFALASQFVSSARLAKVNTCVEDYAVELDF